MVVVVVITSKAAAISFLLLEVVISPTLAMATPVAMTITVKNPKKKNQERTKSLNLTPCRLWSLSRKFLLFPSFASPSF